MTFVPSGDNSAPVTFPIGTPAIRTEASFLMPPTFVVRRRSVYVVVKNVSPLLKFNARRASTARQTTTNAPTFHSNRFWFISKTRFLRVGNAVHKTMHNRVL